MDKQKTAGIGHDWRTEHPPSAPRIEEWGSAPAPRPSIVFSQAEAEAQDAAHGWYVAPGDSLNSGWVVAPDKREMEPTKMPSEKAWRHISAIAPAVGDTVLSGLGRHDGNWLITGSAMGDDEPEIPVTPEMYDAGCAFLAAEGISGDRITSEYILDNIYPAMAVVAPERKRAADLEATNTLALSKIAELEAEHFRLVTALNDSHKRIGELLVALARFKVAAEEAGNHDYNGPTQDGKAVPDPAHERFHGAIGDVLAGKIIPAARRQMQEALKSAPKEPAPIRPLTNTGDPRRIGWA